MLFRLATDFAAPGLDAGMEGVAGGFMAALAGFFVVGFVLALALYVFTSFAFMKIGRKAGDEMAGLAWIPGIGPALIAFRASNMHWWPWLLLIGIIVPIVGFLFMLAWNVFAIIWLWKLFERIKRPGWWAILTIIPVVNLIIIGLAAWTEP